MSERGLHVLNALALSCCVGGAGLLSVVVPATSAPAARVLAVQEAAPVAGVIKDASGVEFRAAVATGDPTGAATAGATASAPVAAFQRIASASILTDRLLLELCEPDRVVAFSSQARTSPASHRFAGKPVIGSLEKLEEILSLKPDLLLVSGLGQPHRLQALRDAGLTVFDVGPLLGTESVVRVARDVGALLGRSAQAERLIARQLAALRAVARDVPVAQRRSALYVAALGGQVFGGTRGSSYGEVLSYGGVLDVAPAELTGWPRYTPEQLLSVDPDVLVTQEGMSAPLCKHAGMNLLRACRGEADIVELSQAVLDDPGLGILEASEELFEAVYVRGH